MNSINIIPLGTISPYCKNDMNCPGYLIKYKDINILLDCGNGISRLLNFPSILNNLHVFISHYHLDHYSDIGTIQYASYVYKNLGYINKSINIYLPISNIEYRKDSIINNKETYSIYNDINDNLVYNIDDLRITFHNNKSHTIETFSIKLETNDFKIVYTSDVGTTNINQLVDFCSNADILICESSFLKIHKSNSKTHLTAFDAAWIAKNSNTKKLVLTHFWPEEDKNLYLNEAKEIFENTITAEEGAKILLKRG